MRASVSGLIRAWVVASASLLIGCASAEAPAGEASAPASATRSLYDRLGGERAIGAVVDDFIPRASANPRVNFARKGTTKVWEATPENIARVRKGLVEFIGSATGGPQKYAGKPMKEAHAGMRITGAQFDAAAADLAASLDALKVPRAERDELLALVATTRADIVETK